MFQNAVFIVKIALVEIPLALLKETGAEESEVECTALVESKPHGLLVAQTMFKKSIRISIKSFLISLSLGFLNLFI